MLIIVIINVNDLDLDSVIQCLYLINNLQESLINLFIIYLFIYLYKLFYIATGRLPTTAELQFFAYKPFKLGNTSFPDEIIAASI